MFAFFTSDGGWLAASLISVFFLVCMLLSNQYFKKPGRFLVLWFRSIIVISLLPIMFFIDWPDNHNFYIFTALSSAFACFLDMRTFDVLAKYGGGFVSRIKPITIFIAFPLWFCMDFSLFYEYLENPLNSLGIVVTLIGVGYFASRSNRNEINKEAFKMFMPALLAGAIATVFNKAAMVNGSTLDAVVCYMFIQSALVLPIMVGYNTYVRRFHKLKVIVRSSKNMLIPSLITAMLWFAIVLFKCTAMITIPNPAYFIAIGQLAPVLISLFYFAIKHKEEGDVINGFGVVACAVVMAFLAV